MPGTNAYVEVASICYIWQIRSHSVAGFFLGAFLVIAAASVQIFDLKLNEASQGPRAEVRSELSLAERQRGYVNTVAYVIQNIPIVRVRLNYVCFYFFLQF